MTKEKDNTWILMCFIFSPILGYTSLIYTESLFILLTLLGYYLYKKDKYILSALVVGLSSLTRNSGIILWGAIGLDMLYRLFAKKDIKFKNIVIFGLIGLSISMIYPTYLYITTGDFLKFASVQTEYWHRLTGTPIHNFLSDIIVLQRGYLNVLTVRMLYQMQTSSQTTHSTLQWRSYHAKLWLLL
jgi:Gpi18-like mannosyltransferase